MQTISLPLFSFFKCMCVCVCWFSLSIKWVPGLNSNLQNWQQEPFTAEPSRWPHPSLLSMTQEVFDRTFDQAITWQDPLGEGTGQGETLIQFQSYINFCRAKKQMLMNLHLRVSSFILKTFLVGLTLVFIGNVRSLGEQGSQLDILVFLNFLFLSHVYYSNRSN